MPEVAFVRSSRGSGDKYVTLLVNRVYSSMTSMFKEQKNRLLDDTLSVIPSFIGVDPNAFFQVNDGPLARFVDAIGAIETGK